MDLTLDGLTHYAHEFVAALPQAAGDQAYVLGLRGDLGAGKTTFVQAVAHELGVKESVTSPTYVIVQSYATTHPIFKKLVHIDAYRLTRGEPDTIGLAAYVADPSSLVLIEWSENVSYMIDFSIPVISFETIDENTRRVLLDGK